MSRYDCCGDSSCVIKRPEGGMMTNGGCRCTTQQLKREVGLLKMGMNEWISVNDSLPEYGSPVLVVSNGVVQNVTYMLDSGGDCPDWFEPYHFDSDDECKFWWDKATFWMPLPEPPKVS